MNATDRTFQTLRQYESRNVTFLDPDGSWPIVWERARGVYVWDVEGRKYLDLTAAFGVAAAGHATPRVVRAGQRQMMRLLHAMGDVHPHALKAKLARELSRITFERWLKKNSTLHTPHSQSRTSETHGKTIFCNSGFEAVEAALKTAALATAKRGIIAFKGAYHGLGYGTLNVTHRKHFRGPFLSQLRQFGRFVPFPETDHDVRDLRTHLELTFKKHKPGAILVEPIQVRGGINVPPPELLPMLRELCDRFGALLILDEIYTGFGRTGTWFACEHSHTVPDLICLGKALTGGFPLSACVGRAEVMDAAWPVSRGEAIHTSTFLGHPVGCAMALAQISELRRRKLAGRSWNLGSGMLQYLHSELRLPNLQVNIRGTGLLIGIELLLPNGEPATSIALAVIKQMLQQGYILLPEGEHANIISLTPPLTISEGQLRKTVRALAVTLNSACTSHPLQ